MVRNSIDYFINSRFRLENTYIYIHVDAAGAMVPGYPGHQMMPPPTHHQATPQHGFRPQGPYQMYQQAPGMPFSSNSLF